MLSDEKARTLQQSTVFLRQLLVLVAGHQVALVVVVAGWEAVAVAGGVLVGREARQAGELAHLEAGQEQERPERKLRPSQSTTRVRSSGFLESLDRWEPDETRL